MGILVNILISVVATALTAVGLYNYAPVSFFEIGDGISLGATSITTINATDKISDSRTTINDNFTALNNGKIENATTSLPHLTTLAGLTSAASLATIGTITTGVWNGTAVTAANGGTGSTTLALDRVLLGNGTGILKTVTGFGSSGQFLTSGGADTPPTWTTAAVDIAGSYVWTGPNHFSYSALFSQPINLNTVSYTFPSATGTANTFLKDVSGTGTLTWTRPDEVILCDKYQATASTSIACDGMEAVDIMDISLTLVSASLAANHDIIINGDQSAVYSWRYSASGAAESTGTSDTGITLHTGSPGASAEGYHYELSISASSTPDHMITGTGGSFTDPTVAPERTTMAGYHTATSSITSIRIWSTGASTLDSGTRLIIKGRRNP